MSLLSRAITGPARPGFAFSRQDLPGQSNTLAPSPNDALDKWFQKQDDHTRELVYDLLYVNGDNLENPCRSDQTWKVRRMEEEFMQFMFEVRDGSTRNQESERIMIAEVMATVENVVLKLDGALPFPDQTRVKLTVEAIETEPSAAAAWNRLKDHIRQHPIPGLAANFSREEL